MRPTAVPGPFHGAGRGGHWGVGMTNRIRFTTARQVAEAFPAAADLLGEVPDDVTPLDHMTRLSGAVDPGPAILFTALMLPKREAVWWGCLCLRGLGLADVKTAEGIAAAEAWVRKPDEDERRAAGQTAEVHNFEGPGAWIAFAAFTTGGSLAPAGLQAVPPPPDIAGRSVYAAIMQGLACDDALERIGRMRCVLACAQDFIAGRDGTGPWKAGVVKPTAEEILTLMGEIG